MIAARTHTLTRLLIEWSNGNEAALHRLMPAVYGELRRQAHRYLRRERRLDGALQTTALVHEAYLKLIDQHRVRWQNRAHFFGVAAQLMRRVLVDHARAQATKKRGGASRLTLSATVLPAATTDVDVLAVDEALARLGAIDPEQSRLVELRFFGGLTIRETAEVLGISPATVKREWELARAWLYRALSEPARPSP